MIFTFGLLDVVLPKAASFEKQIVAVSSGEGGTSLILSIKSGKVNN